jgi:hypothetical protein
MVADCRMRMGTAGPRIESVQNELTKAIASIAMPTHHTNPRSKFPGFRFAEEVGGVVGGVGSVMNVIVGEFCKKSAS